MTELEAAIRAYGEACFRSASASEMDAKLQAAILQAARATPADQSVCKCTITQRLVGDGCSVCNPELAAELCATLVNQEPIYQAHVIGVSSTWLDCSKDAYDHMLNKPLIFETRIVYAQPPQNAADHIEAQSVRDAWISVDERLPEGGELVLVCVRNGVQSSDDDAEEYECEAVQVVDFGQFNEPGGYMECFAGPHGAFADDIKHWQPLPAPPQKPVSDEVKP